METIVKLISRYSLLKLFDTYDLNVKGVKNLLTFLLNKKVRSSWLVLCFFDIFRLSFLNISRLTIASKRFNVNRKVADQQQR